MARYLYTFEACAFSRIGWTSPLFTMGCHIRITSLYLIRVNYITVPDIHQSHSIGYLVEQVFLERFLDMMLEVAMGMAIHALCMAVRVLRISRVMAKASRVSCITARAGASRRSCMAAGASRM